VRLLVPDSQVYQQPCRNVHIIHNTQRSGVYLGCAVVPHKVANPGSHHAKKHQNAPLQRGLWHFLRISQQEPCNHRHQERAKIEPRKGVMLRHRASFHQTFVTHHADGKSDIGELHQQQANPEVVGDLIIANNPGTNHRQQGAKSIAPAQTALTHDVINQRNVERRQYGEQQQFGDRQVEIGAKTQHIHHAELHRAHQHIQADRFQAIATGTQKRQKNECRQANAHQHRKIAIDVPRKVLAIKAKGEGPQNRGDDK